MSPEHKCDIFITALGILALASDPLVIVGDFFHGFTQLAHPNPSYIFVLILS